jgi:hypothetical protein
VRPEWKTLIDPSKKKELMAQFHKQAKEVHSESEIIQWVSNMGIPGHIKGVIQHEIAALGYHCANFEDVCKFDVEGTKDWVFEVLQNFL